MLWTSAPGNNYVSKHELPSSPIRFADSDFFFLKPTSITRMMIYSCITEKDKHKDFIYHTACNVNYIYCPKQMITSKSALKNDSWSKNILI